jgi:dimethylhistidine N-methyltransferase
MATASLSVQEISGFARDLRQSLTKKPQKEIPSKYLYDELGSALFDAICVLPEYGLTRAETRLLRDHAREMVGLLPHRVRVAELGSGNGRKTRWVLEALARRERRKCVPIRISYSPIEISRSALAACERELGQIDLISVVGFEETYLDGLRAVANRRQDGEHLFVLFLGSTIGNFDRDAGEEFLGEIRATLRTGDALLLGTDLMKETERQLLAYDDPAGVTAAFNKNLLARINRELRANFDLSAFRHESRWNSAERRIEMHLRSLENQCVHIPGARLHMAIERDETLWTESSHKYERHEPVEMARRQGFRCAGQWVDHEWPFAQNLLIAE